MKFRMELVLAVVVFIIVMCLPEDKNKSKVWNSRENGWLVLGMLVSMGLFFWGAICGPKWLQYTLALTLNIGVIVGLIFGAFLFFRRIFFNIPPVELDAPIIPYVQTKYERISTNLMIYGLIIVSLTLGVIAVSGELWSNSVNTPRICKWCGMDEQDHWWDQNCNVKGSQGIKWKDKNGKTHRFTEIGEKEPGTK